MKWKTKSRIFKMIEVLPFSNSAHHFMQRNITRTLPRPESTCHAMVTAANRILDLYRKNSFNEHTQGRFLEIGAGRDLVMAICLRALGIREIVTTDPNPLARFEYINHSASIVSKALDVVIPFFSNYEELEAYGVTYLPSTKIQDLSEGYAKYDCVYSSDTLEHIGVDELVMIHQKINQLLAQNGIVIHLIDVSDHYARADSSITRFNFLTYSDKEWEKYNHRNHYVNRLRPLQYKKIFEDLDYNILLKEVDVEENAMLDIQLISNEFRDMDRREIFALRSRFVLQRASSCQ